MWLEYLRWAGYSSYFHYVFSLSFSLEPRPFFVFLSHQKWPVSQNQGENYWRFSPRLRKKVQWKLKEKECQFSRDLGKKAVSLRLKERKASKEKEQEKNVPIYQNQSKKPILKLKFRENERIPSFFQQTSYPSKKQCTSPPQLSIETFPFRFLILSNRLSPWLPEGPGLRAVQ